MKSEKYKKALNKALALTARSEKSIDEIRSKLKTWGIEDRNEIAEIIEQLIDEKFIDEKRYAKMYVADKLKFNRWGVNKIKVMLKSKGIKESAIESALESINQEEYVAALKNELEKKRSSVKAKNQYDLRGKLMRYALSKGYESDLIHIVINQLLSGD